jgi:hypothetical protein
MKLVRLIKMYLKETYSEVRIGKNVSDPFPTKNGLKHGDALSPLLFIFASECTIKESEENDGRTEERDQNCSRKGIKSRRNSVAVCCSSAQSLSFRLPPKNVKNKIYEALMLPVVLHGCGTWSLALRKNIDL